MVVPSGEDAFTRPGVVLYSSLTQPILKSDLLSCVGRLSPGAFAGLMNRLSALTGLAPPLPVLPPRPDPNCD